MAPNRTADRPRRRLPRLSARMKLAAVALLLVAAMAGSWAYLKWTTSHELADAMAEADRIDPHWKLADLLARKEVLPASENSANLLGSILARFPMDWPNVRKTRPTPLDAPPGSPPTEVVDYMRFEKLPSNERLDNRLVGDLRDALAEIPPVLDDARKLRDMPRGRFDLGMGKNVYATLLPHVQSSRSVARLLTFDAALLAQDGDIDGALRSCEAMVNVARSLGDEPFLISQIVRLVNVLHAVNTVERVLGQGRASDAELARLQAAFLDEAGRPQHLVGMRGERAATHEVFTQLAAGELTMAEVISSGGAGDSSTPAILAHLGTPYVHHNHALALRMLNEAVEIAKRPMPEQPALWKAWEARRKVPDAFMPRLLDSLGYETVPDWTNSGLNFLRSRAELTAMATLLAAERHRLRHGGFPASAEAIDRDLLPRPLEDPFSGAPLRYLLRDGNLTVYSLGPDGKDDGATFHLKQWLQPGHDLGHRLYRDGLRARAPALDTLPDRVFVREPKAEDEPARPKP